MIDDGAPIVSVAQAEFEQQAALWQEQARTAAANAARCLSLALSLSKTYRHLIARTLDS